MYQKLSVIGRVMRPELNLEKKYFKFTINTYKSFMKDNERIYINTFFNAIMFSGDLKKFAALIVEGINIFAEGELDFRKVESPNGDAKYYTTFKIENFRLLSEGKKKLPLSDENQSIVDEFMSDLSDQIKTKPNPKNLKKELNEFDIGELPF